MTGVWSALAALCFVAVAYVLPKHEEPMFVDDPALVAQGSQSREEMRAELESLRSTKITGPDAKFKLERRAELEAIEPTLYDDPEDPLPFIIHNFDPLTPWMPGYIGVGHTGCCSFDETGGCIYFRCQIGGPRCGVTLQMKQNFNTWWESYWIDCPPYGQTTLGFMQLDTYDIHIDGEATKGMGSMAEPVTLEVLAK